MTTRNTITAGVHIGPYVVVGAIGSGGMGEVFLAEDSRLRRRVALKRLFCAYDGAATVRDNLLHEAIAIARIAHQNVAMVYDVFDYEGQPLIVLEYVEGETLASRLVRQRLTPEAIVRIGRQLASGVAAAHAKGIIHRDIKPSNIQVARDDSVKIVDFGIAKIFEIWSSAPTATARQDSNSKVRAVQPGTLGYMAPEQMLGQHVGPAADIFSLGVVLFEMATGRRPFPGQDALQIMAAMTAPSPPFEPCNGHITLQLQKVISDTLVIDPAQRLQSAAELEQRLLALEGARSPSTDMPTMGGPIISDVPTIRTLRGRLILAREQSELVRLKYEVESYLATQPSDVDGRVLRDNIEAALQVYAHRAPLQLPVNAPAARWAYRARYAVGVVMIVALGALFSIRRLASVPHLPVPPAAPRGATAKIPPVVPSTSPSYLPGPRDSAVPSASEAEAQVSREAGAKVELEFGMHALEAGDYEAAIKALTAAQMLSGRNDFGTAPGNTTALLLRARTALHLRERNGALAAKGDHAAAAELLSEARRIADSDPVSANRKVKEARTLDPTVEGADELATTLADRARQRAEVLLSNAALLRNVRDRGGEIDVLRRAIELLEIDPASKNRLEEARQRLAFLNGAEKN